MTEEEDETRRKTFVETGSDAFWSGEEVTMEGFLSMKLGGWRKRWCVIKEETFMFFHGKQEALKQGWLSKKGAGTGTLSRCVLQGLPLHHNTACRDVCGGMALVSSSAPSLPCVCVRADATGSSVSLCCTRTSVCATSTRTLWTRAANPQESLRWPM